MICLDVRECWAQLQLGDEAQRCGVSYENFGLVTTPIRRGRLRRRMMMTDDECLVEPSRSFYMPIISPPVVIRESVSLVSMTINAN